MKSVLQACWLLTVAFGNLIVAVLADLQIFEEQSYEFFFYGGLMLVDIMIFAIIAYFYQPSVLPENDDDNMMDDENSSNENIALDEVDKSHGNDKD